jgi:hypothetical protein
MNPQRSEKEKDTGRSQKGFERRRNRTSSPPSHGGDKQHREGPTGQRPEDDFEDDDKSNE